MRRLRMRVLFASATMAAVLAGSAQAATLKPTRTDDPKPNGCKVHDCSLREAISKSNQLDGKDTIAIPAGRYVITRPDSGNDDNKTGDFDVTDETVIKGKGPARTTVDGNGIDRVFTMLGFSKRKLSGVKIVGGNGLAGGGGVFVGPSPLKISNVVIKRNTAVGDGGGVRSVSPRLTLRRVTIQRNTAGGSGGGMALGVSVADIDDTFTQSTISGNVALEDGGGIVADGTDTAGAQNNMSAVLENSTVAGNEANGSGGGIANRDDSLFAIDNATVAYNEAERDSAGGATGGGILNDTAAFTVFDSLVAANTVGSTGANPQCSGAFLGSTNVLTAPTGCASFSQGPDNIVANALIGPLARNGGPTKTIEPQAGSPALGFVSDCPARDQRGKPRPATDCDAGSVERKAP